MKWFKKIFKKSIPEEDTERNIPILPPPMIDPVLFASVSGEFMNKQLTNLNQEIRKLSTDRRNLVRVGNQLSNVVYNLVSRGDFDNDETQKHSLQELIKEWDKVSALK